MTEFNGACYPLGLLSTQCRLTLERCWRAEADSLQIGRLHTLCYADTSYARSLQFQIVVLSSWLHPWLYCQDNILLWKSNINVVAVTQQLQVSALAMGTHATLHDSRTVSISRIFLWAMVWFFQMSSMPHLFCALVNCTCIHIPCYCTISFTLLY